MADTSLLLVVYGAFVIGLISPGPDLILVTALSLKGQSQALWAALGIAAGVGLWVIAAAAGLSKVIAGEPQVWEAVRYIGGGALIYMGSRLISACIRGSGTVPFQPEQSGRAAPFVLGLMTNLANPKAAIVLVGLTTVLGEASAEAGADQSGLILVVLGMPLLTALWFTLVASVLSHDVVRNRLLSSRRILDGLTGVALAAVGILLIQSVQT